VLDTRIGLSGLGQFKIQAGNSLLSADAALKLHYSVSDLGVAALADLQRSLTENRLSLQSLAEFVKHPGFSLEGKLRLGGLPITKFSAESPTTKPIDRPLLGAATSFALNYQAYGAIVAPAGSLFDVTVPAFGYTGYSYNAERGYSLTAAILPTLSAENINAHKGLVESFPVYGYFEAKYVTRFANSVDIGFSGFGSISSPELFAQSESPPTDPAARFLKQIEAYQKSIKEGLSPKFPKLNLGFRISGRF
jgi:hypothetical protein